MTIALSDYAGKVVVLNFWGSWCAPCRDEAPSLEAAVHLKYKRSGRRVCSSSAINVKDPQGAGAQRFN